MKALITTQGLSHRYGKTVALEQINLSIQPGQTVALIGPDGVGKSTLLALIAGAKRIQQGALCVFDGDIRQKTMQRQLQQRVAYMPQGLGKNLYAELSIRENLAFFGRLYGHGKHERQQRIQRLLTATGLAPFADRPAGKLSGGMKQKLGLCCALIHDPELLILDEPTTGVDPLSRRQFWKLIDDIRHEQNNLTVLIATSYMEEAEQFDTIIMLDDGKIIKQGTAHDLKKQSGETTLEKAFIAFLPEEKRREHIVSHNEARDFSGRPIAIEAKKLTKRFGDFVAVDHVDFKIHTGEIFGFIGSNGCGKTTTMKMLTGLLSSSEGSSFLFGKKLIASDLENRCRIGYMSQTFSLYSELTVHQNLTLHANLFGLSQDKATQRIQWIYDTFDLTNYRHENTAALPLGVRQRLSLAVSVIHEPEILILDEPTSGVDPIARDNFWAMLLDLARQQNVTIFISTHFMDEAARCDRISLMHAGKVIATGTPAELQANKQAVSLDDAFVAYLKEVASAAAMPPEMQILQSSLKTPSHDQKQGRIFSLRRMLAYMLREITELRRDPVRLSIATLGTSLLMMIFGFGITLDVNSLSYAALNRDRSPESRAYLENFAGSPYFITQPPLYSEQALHARMTQGNISLALEIPPFFGKDLHRNTPTEVSAIIDGSMPFRAETIAGYVQAMHQRFLRDHRLAAPSPMILESRYRYNQSFESANAMVPSIMGLLLVFIPAILAALSVVREKELGSIANLYVTPVSRAEFILGKQVPYILFSMLSFIIMFLLAIFVFQVPLKGSFAGLSLGALAYVSATTGLGLLISSFTRTQAAALFGTAILTMMPATQFSGMLHPVASLEGAAHWIGTLYPTTYFLKISIGAFTKGLELHALLPFILSLALFVPALLMLNIIALRKQEA